MASQFRRLISDVGTFDITLDRAGLPADAEYGSREFGTIWITTVWHSEGEARNVAVYAGMVKKISKSLDRQLVQLSGSSLEWHLGTARDIGPVMTGVISLIGTPNVSVTTALMWPLVPEPVPFWVPIPYEPDGGRIDNGAPGIVMFSNYQALQTRSDYLNIIRDNHPRTEWLVNPRTRKVEFGRPEFLHSERPVLHQYGDVDPTIPSVAIENATLASDWEDYFNQVVLMGANIGLPTTPPATITQKLQWPFDVSSPYRLPTGEPMIMVRGEDHGQLSIIGLAAHANGLLTRGERPQHTFACTVKHFDPGGPLQPGSLARVWAPDIDMYDPGVTPINFAGEPICPIDLTVTGIEADVQAGMGVYWQYGGAGSEVIDLTDFFVPGSDDATLVIGEWRKKNVPRRAQRRIQQARYN